MNSERLRYVVETELEHAKRNKKAAHNQAEVDQQWLNGRISALSDVLKWLAQEV